jgi:hypothetical protein
MKRGAKIAASFTIFAVATLALWVLLFEPFKVTDPDDPRFDPMRFKFSDYKSDKIPFTLKRIFSPGASKEFVENILVKSANAKIEQHSHYYIMYVWNFPIGYSSTYTWHLITPNTLYSVAATYDDKDKLTGMTMLAHEIFNENAIKQAQQNAMIEERVRLNKVQSKE